MGLKGLVSEREHRSYKAFDDYLIVIITIVQDIAGVRNWCISFEFIDKGQTINKSDIYRFFRHSINQPQRPTLSDVKASVCTSIDYVEMMGLFLHDEEDAIVTQLELFIDRISRYF